jgi:predicted permease
MSDPPRFTRSVLRWLLGPGTIGRSVLGDLDEEYRDRATLAPRPARRWYRREAIGIAVRAQRIARHGHASRRTWSAAHEKRGGDSMIRTVFQDMHGALRHLRGQPRFAITASLTLAIGIGAVTSIFSVVNGVLIKPLPYADAGRLVNVWSHAPGLGYDQFGLSPDLYFFYREHNQVFDDMALYQNRRANLTELEAPQVIEIRAATASYFPTLGVPFSLGRSFAADEDRPNGPAVAIISHRLWRAHFGSDPAVVGRAVRLDGASRQIVGVTPDWLDAARSPDAWIPAQLDPAHPPAGNFAWNAIARVKAGVRPEDAAAHLVPLVQRAMQETIASPTYRAFLTEGRYAPGVHDMKEDVVGDVRQPLWVLLGTVAMVLLIACANVANLMLIRADARQREIAVRVALGSSRANLIRKLLIEAVVLSAIGTALGVAASAAMLPGLLSLAPDGIPRLDRVGLDPVVIAFAVIAAFVSAILFGLVPAVRYTRPAMLASLRQGGRGGTEGPTARRARNALVVAQTALALVLLVGSGLLLRSFTRMMTIDLGFDPSHAMTFRVALPQADYADGARVLRFEEDLLQRLAAIGIAGAASNLPVTRGTSGAAFDIDGRPTQPDQLPPMIHYSTVSPGFFDAMRIDLLSGRDFDSRDRAENTQVVIVNKALADQYWPGDDPVGKRLRPTSSETPGPSWLTVVGVVQTVRQDGLREPVRPLIYFPQNAGGPQRVMNYVVRGPAIAARADDLRRAVWALDADLPVAAMQSLETVVESSIVEFRFTMLTLAIASGMALLLGAIGLYGVLSYAVSLRTREFGVRLALGAQPSLLLRSVMGTGAAIVGVGLLVGLAGAAGLSRFLRGILFEVEPIDPLTFGATSGALVLVGLLASYLPARRAAAVSPLESMRAE